MWPVKTCLFFFGFIGACALSVVYPIIGIVNYMMIYQVNPNEMWWGLPLEPLGLRYSMAAAVCLILGMFVSVGRVPKSKVFFGDWLLLLFLFTFIVFFSGGGFTNTTNYSVMLIDKMIKINIFLVCLVRMGSTLRNYKIIIWAIVAGTVIIGYDAFYAPAGEFVRGRLNFVGGTDFRESSGLAAHMVGVLPLLGALFLITRNWYRKGVIAVAGVLAVNTIIQCRTRSAFIGLLVGACVALIMAPRGKRAKIYVTLIVAAIGAYSLTDSPFWERMNTAINPSEYMQDAAVKARIELWSIAGDMFLDHPFGLGVGQFKEYVGEYAGQSVFYIGLNHRVPHNSYLLCLTELGIHGGAVFLLLIIGVLCKIKRTLALSKRTMIPHEGAILAYGCLLSVVSYLGAATFTDRLYTESFWWILTLPVCLEQAIRREITEQESVPELLSAWRLVLKREDDHVALPAGTPRRAFG